MIVNSVASDALLDRSSLSSEAALVLCCATTAATIQRTAMATELAARVRNWDTVIGIAERHAVLPIVHRYLSLECAAAVPADAMTKLRTRWQLIALYNRHLTAELVRLTGLLRSANIAAVAFKGPVLAAMAYGSIDLRQFVDLDILVRQSDLPRVAEILTAEQYLSPHSRREGLATNYFQECEDAFFQQAGWEQWTFIGRSLHARSASLPTRTPSGVVRGQLNSSAAPLTQSRRRTCCCTSAFTPRNMDGSNLDRSATSRKPYARGRQSI